MSHPARLLLALAAVGLWSCRGERDPRAGSSPWVLERVDMRGETGTGLALAVAGDGAILLSYYDRHHGDVMFAELRPWGWRRERVASAASWSPTGLGVDEAGRPHILYFVPGENSLGRLLAHSWRERGVWRQEILAAPADGEWLARIAGPVFVDGVLHAAYMRAVGLETHSLVHGWRTEGGEWREEEAVARVTPTSDLTLLAAPDGTLHLLGAMLVYAPGESAATANSLLVAIKRPGGPWSREEVLTLSPDPYALASWWSPRGVRVGAALGPGGELVVSYPILDGKFPHVRLELAHRRDGDWELERVDWVGVVGRQSTVGHGPDGTLWVAYRNGTNQDLKVASRAPGGTWLRRTVDSGRDMGDYPHLALPPDGRVSVVYRDSLAGTLRHASLSDDGTWQRETFDRQGEVGEFASLAVDRFGVVAIAYYEGSPSLDAKISVRVPGRPWRRERVAVLGEVGRRSRLAVFPDRAAAPLPAGAAVVYQDESAHSLMAALPGPDGEWKAETVADDITLGSLPGVAFTPDGVLHVTYLDKRSRAYLHSWRQGGRWRRATLDDAEAVGWGSVLAVAVDGTLHTLYLDTANGLLKHATLPLGGDAWQAGVAVSGQFGPRLGLAVAPDGTVHASLYAAGTKDLLHAWRRPGQPWRTETVATAGDVGHQSALALAPDGSVHIAYYDSSQARLRHAWLGAGADRWRLETVDEGQNAGEHPSIAVGIDGTVHIAYRLGDPSWALMYAWLGPGARR